MCTPVVIHPIIFSRGSVIGASPYTRAGAEGGGGRQGEACAVNLNHTLSATPKPVMPEGCVAEI